MAVTASRITGKPRYCPFPRGIYRGGFPAQRDSNAQNVSIWWRNNACFIYQWFLKCVQFIYANTFVGDANTVCTRTDINETFRLVNEEICKIFAWVNASRLSLNIDKTNSIWFTHKFFSLYRWYCYKPNQNKAVKILGVIIHNKLKWSANIMCTNRRLLKKVSSNF